MAKHKYIFQLFPHYFIFGECPKTGKVDVSNGTDDVYQLIDKPTALKIIEDRDKLLEVIVTLSDKIDDEDLLEILTKLKDK